MNTSIKIMKNQSSIVLHLLIVSSFISCEKAHASEFLAFKAAAAAYEMYSTHQIEQRQLDKFSSIEAKINQGVETILNRLDQAELSDARAAIRDASRFLSSFINTSDEHFRFNVHNVIDRAFGDMERIATSPTTHCETRLTALNMLLLLGPYLLVSLPPNQPAHLKDTANQILNALNKSLEWEINDHCWAFGTFAGSVILVFNPKKTSMEIPNTCREVHPNHGGPRRECQHQIACRSRTFGWTMNEKDYKEAVRASIPNMPGYSEVQAVILLLQGIRDRA